MTLNQLRYFQTVARFENYHLAAAELYVSQPSLSRSISALERELGVALFEKAGRGIALTKYGAVFLEYADRILNEFEIAESAMKRISGDGGQIDVGYVMPMINCYVPQVTRSFLEREENRNVTFRFFEGWTSAILREMKEGRLDACFCAYIEHEEEVAFHPVLRQDLVLIAPYGTPLAERGEASVQELTRHPVIGYHEFSWMGKYTRSLYQRLGIQPKVICECTSESGIQSFVETGLGIALVVNAEALDGKRVRILRLADLDEPHWIYLAWMKHRSRIPAVDRFLRFVRDESPPEDGSPAPAKND